MRRALFLCKNVLITVHANNEKQLVIVLIKAKYMEIYFSLHLLKIFDLGVNHRPLATTLQLQTCL